MITVFGSGVTLDELREIEAVPPPGAGRRWKAIPHADLVDTIKDEVLTRGWTIEEEKFSTARDGADLAGALLLGKVKGVETIEGMTLGMGFLHSNARRRALQITAGGEVACCNNGMCSGSLILNRVHDHTVDLVDEVEAAVDRYVLAAQAVPDVVRGLRERELPQAEASEILMAAGRRQLVGWAAIGRVDKEYRRPTFAEHGRDTSWALLNAFTYAARGNIGATRQMEVFDTFRQMLPVVDPSVN